MAIPRQCLLVCIASLTMATGCATSPLERRTVDHDELASAGSGLTLRCGYRLEKVADRRPASAAAGAIGRHAFSLEAADQLVSSRLSRIGFVEDASAPSVVIDVRQLYIAQNLSTKIPIAVYVVAIDGGPADVLRSDVASMNWNGTDQEGLRALSTAMADVERQLVGRLNSRCSA
ncbi:hypothetical protein E2F46_12240 [Luteimonas aestuarii]|uniref:DUF4410 domain-containing protein n=1 Tax=Luteimonas aestuarii TaxID=453837 RepID=A0A4R5TRM8_9GAMM|nr:hypothetical protein [Luteimonas aestuarii]TDK23126.1 hypothetical protein E2F46_12240 [Luteimonas aestuarii]